MIIRLLFALAATLVATSTYAATFCVNTSIELQNALDTAATNNEDDVIKLIATTFTPPTAQGFTYNSSESHSLTLEGGFGNPCDLPSQSAALSVIDGGSTNRLFEFIGQAGAGDVHLARLTFRNGTNQDYDPAVNIGGTDEYTGAITLDRVVVRDNVSAVRAIMVSSAGNVMVQNSVFVDNTIVPGRDGDTVARFQSYNSNGPSGGMEFNGNTVSGNVNTIMGATASGYIWVKDGPLSVANSIFWGNTGTDLVVDATGGTTALVSDSDIGSRDFVGSVISTNLYSVEPAFIGNGDYRLAGNSPLRDLGDKLAAGGIGSYDAAGQARVVFGQVDVGAYEVQDSIFKTGFD